MMTALVRSRFALTLGLLVAAGTLAACGGSSEPKIPEKDRVPATITSGVTGTLTGLAGAQLNTALTVTVVNKAGEAIDTIAVTFAVASGGGSLAATSVKTDAAGHSTTTWTLGPSAGTQTVTATVGTLTAVTFTATATAGPAAKLTKNSTDPQTALAGTNVSSPPSVKVTDANNNPIANVLVSFVVASGGGAITGGLANTDANGIATAGSWKLGNGAGPNTVTGTATGITATVTFSATGTVGAVTQVRITSATPPTLNIGGTFTVTAQPLDANNNIVAGAPMAFSSGNTAIATVGATTGIVTATGAGTTNIIATSGTATASQAVSVVGSPGPSNGSTTVLMNSSLSGVVVANNTAYVGRAIAGMVGIVDLPSATLTSSVDLGARTIDVAVNAAGTTIAAARINPNKIMFINAAGALIDSMDVPTTPVKIAMNASGSKLFVDIDNFNVEVIDVASRTITSEFTLGGTVTAMRMAPGDSLMYVATRLGTIYEVSTLRNNIKRSFNSVSAVDLAFTADGKTMFVADNSSNVTIVQLAAGGIADGTITGFTVNSVPSPAQAVGVTPDGRQLWVATPNATFIISITNNNQLGVVTPPSGITAANPIRVLFNRLGTIAVLVDLALNALVISK